MKTTPSKTIASKKHLSSKAQSVKKLSKKPSKKSGDQALINSDLTISQVLQRHPHAAEIMQQFGLHCFGCSVNVFETLKEGILGHGMPESTLTEMLKALNGSLKDYQKDLSEKGIVLTERGALKIVEIAEMEGRKKYGIRVKSLGDGGCCSGATYSMDFEEYAQEGDKILGFHNNVTLFIDRESFEKMKGSRIDYIETYEAAGFKIDNPNATTGACGCQN
ncbi:MAG: iron-sulfur cluster assembly accessory protein [uncultured bacterium]|nr:MAG: iron-sulfur cluster assembly accessory protein [uncultured bacterium]KKT76411.1 MAG: Iron-sulfur cluster assembly accessory protein [Candidatus Peregrinibacteria bacterium GW2011_GWA2_44_7]